jgi:hypothetical protein
VHAGASSQVIRPILGHIQAAANSGFEPIERQASMRTFVGLQSFLDWQLLQSGIFGMPSTMKVSGSSGRIFGNKRKELIYSPIPNAR